MTKFGLADVVEWKPGLSCSIVTLSAISGRTPTEVIHYLDRACGGSGEGLIVPRPDYNPGDWAIAIKLMGAECEFADDYRHYGFPERPTIQQWMTNKGSSELRLIMCDRNGKDAHVFATMNGDVVDFYTDGKRVKFSEIPNSTVPSEIGQMRVKISLRVIPHQ